MPKPLQFEKFMMDNVECGQFVVADKNAWFTLMEELDGVQDGLNSGAMPLQEGIKKLKQMVKSEPCFLDAYAHLGIYLFKKNPTQSAKWHFDGVEKGNMLIPDDFHGKIEWGFLDNRPFLRCHFGYIMSLLRKSKFALAICEIERHLAWNPDDNLGARYLLGDAYFFSKHYDDAIKIYEQYSDEHPPYYYGLGLIHFMKKDFPTAITNFRRGILSNIYIAEILTGKIVIIPKHYWHGISTASPDDAIKYMDSVGEKAWSDREQAVDFLDWLMNCSTVLAERAQYVQQLEALLCEKDNKKRKAHGDKIEAILQNITNTTSKLLVKKMTPLHEKQCWPWEAKGW